MTTPTPRLLPLATDSCACCAPGADPVSSAPSAEAPAADSCACCAPGADPVSLAPSAEAPAATGSASEYAVAGMTCGHCVSAVTAEVAAIAGVAEVTVELNAGAVSVVRVSGTAIPATVIAAIAEAGYSATAR